MQGCPAIQAELNAPAAPGVKVPGKDPPGQSATGRLGGQEENWNGNKLEWKDRGRHTRETQFWSFNKSKVGRDMPFPSAHRSQKLTRVTRIKANQVTVIPDLPRLLFQFLLSEKSILKTHERAD